MVVGLSHRQMKAKQWPEEGNLNPSAKIVPRSIRYRLELKK